MFKPRKISFLIVLSLFATAIQTAYAAKTLPDQQKIVITSSPAPTSGSSKIQTTNPGPNSAPVIDPTNTLFIQQGKSANVVMGAFDSQGDTMTLSATGDLVASSPYITFNGNGRIEAIVRLSTTTSTPIGAHTVTYTVQDSRGGTTTASVQIYVSAITFYDNPIQFGPISHKMVKMGEMDVTYFFVHDMDSTTPNVVVTGLPAGSLVQVQEQKPGYYSGRIYMAPTTVGTYDVRLFAFAAGSYNQAIATMRITVNANNKNSAPTIDPLSSRMIVRNIGQNVNVGAKDSEGHGIVMTGSGINLASTLFITQDVPGSFQAIAPLSANNSTDLGYNNLSITAMDYAGAMTVVQIPIATVLSGIGFDNPITPVTPISNYEVQVGHQLTNASFVFSDVDGDALDLSAAMPAGAILNKTLAGGVAAGEILWQPSSFEVGLHDIKLFVNDTVSGKNNSCIATIRVNVIP